MQSQEEYIEQAFFFAALRERIDLQLPMQDVLAGLREEVLATTKLPLAIQFLRDELIHSGLISKAMKRLSHYFSPFQAFVMSEAESDRGRFDFRVGLEILQREAEYRAKTPGTVGGPKTAGIFLYQFEALCRNRLSYDEGLRTISEDPAYDEAWQEWILMVRRQIGIVDFGDMVYVRSAHYAQQRARAEGRVPHALASSASNEDLDTAFPTVDGEHPTLFGEKEGRIALANRRKDPLLMLSAFQRHLGYPAVPRLVPTSDEAQLLPQIVRRVERLETRLKLMEDDQKGGIDLTQFYGPPSSDE